MYTTWCTIMKLCFVHTVYVGYAWFPPSIPITPLHIIYRPVIAIVTDYVHCQVRSEVLCVHNLDERQSSKGLTDLKNWLTPWEKKYLGGGVL